MCVDIYLHNTSYAHESRWVSLINPGTGWAVYSPFQEPYRRCCATPCLKEPVPAQKQCPWHGGCCVLDRLFRRCAFYDRASNFVPCSRPLTVLHFYQGEGTGAGGEVARIPASYVEYLLICDPLFLSLQNQLFNAGAELILARTCYASAARRFEELRFIDGLLTPPVSPAVGRRATVSPETAAVRQELTRCDQMVRAADAYVTELARYWDHKSATGGKPGSPTSKDFTPRPGREPEPLNNLMHFEDTMFRVFSYGLRDKAPIPFPNNVPLRPGGEFERVVRAHSANSHIIAWSQALPVVNGNTILPC